MFGPQTILIEDKASGTQLIQELVAEGMHAIQKYEPSMNKVIRMNTVTSMIECGFVHVPDKEHISLSTSTNSRTSPTASMTTRPTRPPKPSIGSNSGTSFRKNRGACLSSMSIGQNYQGSFLVLVQVHFFVTLAEHESHHSHALERNLASRKSSIKMSRLRIDGSSVVPGRNCPADKILYVPSDTKCPSFR